MLGFYLTTPNPSSQLSTIIDCARRELEEEAGAIGGTFEEIGILYDYPSKDMHVGHVVRATGVSLTNKSHHEETESIQFEAIEISELKRQILGTQWQSSAPIAALVLSGLLF